MRPKGGHPRGRRNIDFFFKKGCNTGHSRCVHVYVNSTEDVRVLFRKVRERRGDSPARSRERNRGLLGQEGGTGETIIQIREIS